MNKNSVDIETVEIEKDAESQLIIGHSGFIKSAEDLYELMVNSVPGVKFGIAFVEASGPCLVRSEGNDKSLKSLAEKNAMKIGAGHTFVIIFKEAYPINIVTNLSRVPEVVNIYCATSNPTQVLIAKTSQGRSILGVVDGNDAKGIEPEEERQKRRKFLRDIGYKL